MRTTEKVKKKKKLQELFMSYVYDFLDILYFFKKNQIVLDICQLLMRIITKYYYCCENQVNVELS